MNRGYCNTECPHCRVSVEGQLYDEGAQVFAVVCLCDGSSAAFTLPPEDEEKLLDKNEGEKIEKVVFRDLPCGVVSYR